MNDNSYRVIEVDINEILPNRFQPRIQFDEEEILELSDSIKEHGVLQPIVVRTIGDKYEIIAGERRYKASVLAGKETVPVIIKNLNDKDSAEIALIENIQRKNLTPIEEALSYKKILDMGYLTQENLAIKLGKSQSAVANKIRLLNLSDEVQEALLDNKISERHARSLLKLKTVNEQNELLNKIVMERLTVRKTDEEIEKMLRYSVTNNEELNVQNKILEKGETNMNNEININQNNIPQPNNNTFDIFQTTPTVSNVGQMPVVEPVAPVQPVMPEMGGFRFDVNEPVMNTTPVVPIIPNIEPMPVVEPVAPVQPIMPEMGGFRFDVNEPVMNTTPVVPTIPNIEPMPVVEPVAPVQPIMPEMGGFRFDVNEPVMNTTPAVPTIPNIEPMPVVEPVAPVQPVMPGMSEFRFDVNEPVMNLTSMESSVPNVEPKTANQVPETSPIIDSNPFNSDSIKESLITNNQSESISEISTPVTSNEFVVPEPIIITDYNKQYDPIMPMQAPLVENKVDFKEIINAIRECSEKIEKYGYRIDVEEYDLSSFYQVVFKIEK